VGDSEPVDVLGRDLMQGRGREFVTASVTAVVSSDLGLWMAKTFAADEAAPIRCGLNHKP